MLRYLLCKLPQSALVPCLSFNPKRQKKRSWLKMSAKPLPLLFILYSSAGSRKPMLFQVRREIWLNIGSSKNCEVNFRQRTFRRWHQSPLGSPCMLSKSNTWFYQRRWGIESLKNEPLPLCCQKCKGWPSFSDFRSFVEQHNYRCKSRSGAAGSGSSCHCCGSLLTLRPSIVWRKMAKAAERTWAKGDTSTLLMHRSDCVQKVAFCTPQCAFPLPNLFARLGPGQTCPFLLFFKKTDLWFNEVQ